MASDLQVSFHFNDDADSIERITLLAGNVSGRDCLLTISYPLNFVPVQQPNGPRVELCQRCADRLPGGEEPETLPLVLGAGAFAHQTFRYKTSGTGDAPGCVQVGWISAIANADMKHALLLVSRSLLKPVCSAVDVVGYRPGAGGVVPFYEEPAPGERLLTLNAERSTYYADERFSLHTDAQQPVKGANSILLLSHRSLEGDTRFDEVQAGMSPWVPGRQAGSSGSFAEIDSGARSRWGGFGQHTFQLFRVDGRNATGETLFVRSRPLTVLVADAATITRTWGATKQGVRVDLTLDKTQFRLDEDIAAHIAAQVVDSKEPVYGEPNLLGGAFFRTIAGSFHLAITDADGPLENSDRRANLYNFFGGSSGSAVCPPPLEVGKVIPLDPSLRDVGMLPTRPGTYQLSVTWRPYHSRLAACPGDPPDPPERPFVTVTSNPVTITVVGAPPPTELPQVPEYTAWKAHFRLVDTPFGPQTALLDLATGLEWLRPAITADANMSVTEQGLATRMARETELAGWRFAALDEARTVLAHFTGSPDGSSQDPAVARKLIRLLGGTLRNTSDPQTGWIDSRITVRIAGFTPASADYSLDGVSSTCPTCKPGFWAHAVFICEMVKDGHSTVVIDPDQRSYRTDKQDNGSMVYEGTMHYAGFLLVRKP